MNPTLGLRIAVDTVGDGALAKLSESLDKISAASDAAGNRLKKIGESNPFGNFAGQIKSGLTDPLGTAESALTKFAGSFGTVGALAGGGIAALSAFAAASNAATYSLAELAVQTRDLSLKTGLSVADVGRFGFAAKAAGADIGILETAMRKLSEGLADGGESGKKSREALEALGVRTRTLNGDLRPTAEIFEQVSSGINKIGSAAERNKLMVDLFGRSGIQLVPMLMELNKNLERSKELGVGISDAELNKMLVWQQRITEVDTLWDRAKRKFNEGIAGTIFLDVKGAGGKVLNLLSGNASGDIEDFAAKHGGPPVWSMTEGTPAALKNSTASADARINRVDMAYNNTLEGATSNAAKLKEKADAEKNKLDSMRGGSGDAAVQAQIKVWETAASKARAAADSVKVLSEENAKYVGTLEKMRTLRQAREDFYIIDPGRRQSIVSTQDIADQLKKTRRSVPSLYRNGELPQTGSSQFPSLGDALPLGDQYAGGGLSWVTDTAANNGSGTYQTPEGYTRNAAMDAAGAKGLEKLTSDSDQMKLNVMKQAFDLDSRTLALRAGPGGEYEIADKLAKLREASALKEFSITGDLVSLDDARLRIVKDRLVLQEQLAASRKESFGNAAGGIFDAVTSRQPNALANFFKSQALDLGRTVTENVAKDKIYPLIEQILPKSGSSLLQGTFLYDPMKTAGTTLTAAGISLNAAADKLLAVTTPGAAGSATAAAGGGTVSGGIASAVSAAASGTPKTLSSLSSFMGNFGAGASSVFSGNALSILLGENTTGPTTTSAQVGAGVGIGGALAAGGFAIAQGLKQGGVGGDLKAAGSAAGLAGGIVSNVSKLMDVASPLLSAIPIVGSLAAMALPLIGGLFNGPQKRENAINKAIKENQYIAPQALNVTQSSSGTFADFDAKGNLRTSNFSPYPQVTQGSVWAQSHGTFSSAPDTYYSVPGGQTSQFGGTVQPAHVVNNYNTTIHAIDTASFDDRLRKSPAAVADAAATGMQNGHGRLTSEVQRAVGG